MTTRTRLAGCLLAVAAACHRAPPTATAPAHPDATPTVVAHDPPASTDPDARARGQEVYDQAYALAMEGDFTAALPLFRQATDVDPTLAVAWFDLAGLSEQLGDADAARVAMERCVAVEPAFIQARVELATLYDDDLDAAMTQLRRALTEPTPFVIDRYTAAHTRGEGLHKVAVTYARLDFPAATASIERSLFADPMADIDPRAARIANRAQDELDEAMVADPARAAALAALARDANAAVTRPAAEAALRRHQALAASFEDGAAIDRWQVWRQLARLELAAEQPEAADASLIRAAEAAKRLPLERWLDTTNDRIAVEVRLGRLDAAARAFDELAWLEYVTANADAPVGGRTRSRRVGTAPELAPLRGRADYQRTVAALGL